MAEDQQQQQRRWSGYVCPDCRAVFRMPRDHDGRGVVCPSCSRVLRIAGADEETPPLVAAGPIAVRRIEPLAESAVRVSRSRSSLPVAFWQLAAGAAVLILIGIVALRSLRDSHVQDSQHPTVAQLPAEIPVVSKLPDDVADNSVSAQFDAEQKRRAAEVVEKFLNAKTVAAVAELVFHPEVTMPRLQQVFPDGAFSAVGGQLIADFEVPDLLVPIATVSVRTADFEIKVVYVHLTPKGPQVDWEAWVARSEMPWETFVKEKRTTPTLFRVTVSPLNYYNFVFADENQWQGYQLLSPNGENSLSGYVPRGSEVEAQLNREIEGGSKALTLLLKYLPNAQSSGQVIIEKMVHNSWAEPSDPSP